MIGLFFVVVALGIYYFSDPSRSGFYNHFVWQADAYLHGRFAISYPVIDGPYMNGYFQDVMQLPGARRRTELCAAAVPATAGDPAHAVRGHLRPGHELAAVRRRPWRDQRGPGVAHDDAADRPTRRVRAGDGLLRLRHGPLVCRDAVDDVVPGPCRGRHVHAPGASRWRSTASGASARWPRCGRSRPARGGTATRSSPRSRAAACSCRWYRRARPYFEPVQFMAGFVFGVAALARLTVIFAAPFFLFVGPGGSMLQARRVSRARRGHPGRAAARSTTCSRAATSSTPSTTTCITRSTWATCRRTSQINTSLGIEDMRPHPAQPADHVRLAARDHAEWRGLRRCAAQHDCPLLVPDQIGMSILLTSPAYLLAVPLRDQALAPAHRRRLGAGRRVRRVRQPDALQPGLGPVRLPLQQ